MARFKFNEDVSIETNLDAFYTHLEDEDVEFADILRRELPLVLDGTKTATDFHTDLAVLLDAEPKDEEAEEEEDLAAEGEAPSEEPPADDQVDEAEADAAPPAPSPRYFLTQLKVEGFRGVNNEGDPLTLGFDADKVNSVYAENGFGKSSLFDALSYAIRGSVPKLDRLEDKENPGDYYNNRFHNKGHAKIELTFTDDQAGDTTTITVERDQEGKRSVTSDDNDEPDEFLSALQNDFLFLDQTTFERFIRDPSQERGQCFTRLLGLSTVADHTAALKKLSHLGTLTRDLDVSKHRADTTRLGDEQQQLDSRLRADFEDLTGEPLSGSIEVQKYADRLLKVLQGIQVIAPKCQVAKFSELDFGLLQEEVKTAEGGDSQKQLADKQQRLKALGDLAAAENEPTEQATLRSLIETRQELLEQTAGPLLLSNYRSALAVLDSESWDDATRCPTCEQVSDAPLVDQLRAKVAAFDNAESKGAEIATTWRAAAWVTRWRQLAAQTDLDQSPVDPTPTTPSGQATESDSEAYTRLAGLFTTRSATPRDLDEAMEALKALEERRRATIVRLTQEIEKLSEVLPPSLVNVSARIATAKHAREQLTRFVTVERDLAAAKRCLARREAWQAFVKQAYDDIRRAEADWVVSREQSIAETCQEMHLAITYNSDVVPGFKRPQASSSRLYLQLEDFHGLKNLSANTLLQESYCTSVAISVYLSTALLFSSKARFLVLDDVTSTFDGGHQWHLMELLRNRVSPPSNPDGLQVILLTHDSLLQKYLDKQPHDSGWKHCRLTGTPPRGNVVTSIEDAGRIKKRADKFLSSGQADEAKPWVRQYLEQVVARIIRKCSIPVPFDYAMSEHKQQLGDSFESIKREITLQQQAGRIVMTPQQQKDAVQSLLPQLIANMMSHYATVTSANVSVRTLQRTMDDTDKLTECFCYDCTCKVAGQTIPRFYKSLAQKHCKC